MPELVTFEPTWLDKEFEKAFKRLSVAEKESRMEDLAALMEALKGCRHPITDPDLARWRPGSYSGVLRLQPHQILIEYRLRGLMRVIACHVRSSAEGVDDRVVLLAATLTHDHDRLKRLVRQHVRAEDL
ncbi:MAG TPA: hypothetical protein VF017_07580 [Thermoanaerobaculia bacterium]|nr:hypothetical protein [Thermoanaerobaculia bacterium]